MKINIGVSLGNIVGHQINKRFIDITFSDIKQIVYDKYGNVKLNIYGWCPTHKQGRKANKS